MIKESSSVFPDDAAFLKIVADLSTRLSNVDNQALLCQRLHEHAFPLLGSATTEIYFYNPSVEQFRPPSIEFGSRFRTQPSYVPKSLRIDDPHVSALKKSLVPTIIENRLASDAFIHTGNSTHLIAPIVADDKIIAIVYVGRRTPYHFTNDHLNGIASLSAIIGSCLKNIYTIKSLKTSVSDLEYTEQLRSALYEISEQAHSVQTMDELYHSLHQIVGLLIPAENFFIALTEKSNDETIVSFPYYSDIYDYRFQGKRLNLSPGDKRSLTSYLIESGKPLLTTPDNFDQICQSNDITCIGTQPTSWLGVPFYLEHMSGAVVVQSYDEIIYSVKDKNLLIYVARHVGDALARKKSIDDLRRSKTKAETAEKNKSAFLANMSHEIRTPMNGIIGITDLLLDSEITDKQYTYLTMVRSSADRLLTLVNDILDFSKIEAGKLELQIEPFKLRETLTETLSILELNAVKKGIILDAHINTDVPDHLNGDPNRLCQVLLNLVHNAIKFTDVGEVRVHIECNRQLLLEQAGHTSLHFMISDTGIGIPEDQQEHIFDAFKQADNIKIGAYDGTGLGLPVTAQLVELMGGRIWLESSPQRGSCFHFIAYFTLFDSNDAEIKKHTSLLKKGSSPSTTSSYNILLAEDDPINQILAIAVLEREGWLVTLAVNGLEVLEKLKRKHYDLVLMDIQMPEMDGYEATRNIRDHEQNSNSHQPIIAMTAYALKGDRQKCLDAGMDGYISKPIDTDLLRIEVETVLKQHQAQPEKSQPN